MNETREAATFWSATLGILLGLAIMLWGVSLNSGTAVNGPMIAGGVVLGAAVALHTVGVMRVDDSEPGTH